MKVIFTLEDFRKVFTPFYNGCHYVAVLDGTTDIGVKLGCFGSMVSLCFGLEKRLCNLFNFNDGGRGFACYCLGIENCYEKNCPRQKKNKKSKKVKKASR